MSAQLIRSAASAYDAILLDVDNGPEGLSRSSNDSLYDAAGLAAARAGAEARRRARRLVVRARTPASRAGCGRRDLQSRKSSVRARGKRGARHVIWLATKA